MADHQRIHQYRGGHQETWGGVTVNIDNNSVDAPVAPFQLAPEGAFVQASGRGLFRIAGGAPIAVSDWAAVGGVQPVQTLSTTQFDSLPNRPREGTFLQSGATGRIWRVAKGVATYVPSWTPYGGPLPSIVIDQAALDNAGTGGVWNHLASGRPAPRTTGPTAFGSSAQQASGSPGSAATRPASSPAMTCGGAGHGGTARSAAGPSRPGGSAPPPPAPGSACGPATRTASRCGPATRRAAVRLDRRPLPGSCVDDRSLARSAGWAAKTAAGFSGRTYLATKRKGASLTRTSARVRRVGVVASTCRTCGVVAVLVDGKRIGRVNLAGPFRRTRVLMLPAFTRRHATVTLRVRSSGAPVRIDGLVLSRT